MPRIELGEIMQKIIPTDQLRPLLDNLFTTDELRDLIGAETLAHLDETALNSPKPPEGFKNLISGFVARAADVAGLNSPGIYRRLGLGYPGSTFTSDQPMFAIRYARGTEHEALYDSASRTAIATGEVLLPDVQNIPLEVLREMQRDVDPLSGRSAYDNMREENYYREDMRGDAISQWAVAHPDTFGDASRATAGWATDSATDLNNAFRGNGFSGTGPDMVPEASYGLRAFTVPPGSEMWMTTTQGSQRLIAIFDRGKWRRIVPSP